MYSHTPPETEVTTILSATTRLAMKRHAERDQWERTSDRSARRRFPQGDHRQWALRSCSLVLQSILERGDSTRLRPLRIFFPAPDDPRATDDKGFQIKATFAFAPAYAEWAHNRATASRRDGGAPRSRTGRGLRAKAPIMTRRRRRRARRCAPASCSRIQGCPKLACACRCRVVASASIEQLSLTGLPRGRRPLSPRVGWRSRVGVPPPLSWAGLPRTRGCNFCALIDVELDARMGLSRYERNRPSRLRRGGSYVDGSSFELAIVVLKVGQWPMSLAPKSFLSEQRVG